MTHASKAKKKAPTWFVVTFVGLVIACCVGVAAIGANGEEQQRKEAPQPVVSVSLPPSSAAPVEQLVAEPTEPSAEPTTVPADVYYASCAAARAAGAAPLHRGDPGYRSGLDRDGDGTACEKK